jgi:hypothetical protein
MQTRFIDFLIQGILKRLHDSGLASKNIGKVSFCIQEIFPLITDRLQATICGNFQEHFGNLNSQQKKE